MIKDFKKLQNGSDIRGVALDGVQGETVNLGKDETVRLTLGFAEWLSEKTGKKPSDISVSVGHDSRLSADFFQEIIVDTLSSFGFKVFNCGLSSTPAMFMSTTFDEYKCDGAIMITASHLPFNRNGFKYFDINGGLNKEDISYIVSFAGDEVKVAQALSGFSNKGEVIDSNLLEVYSGYLRNKIITEVDNHENYDKPLLGLKIVVDAGNGAGGFYAEKILAPLGADISGSQFLTPDGHFPNHQPNPESKEAMMSISTAVVENEADLGLIFDTDVDRSSAVDSFGKEISRNAIVAMAAALIAIDHPGTTIVTDSITSDQLTEYLEKCLGLKHLRFKRGYKNVINKSIELNAAGIDSQLAIETSGHAAYKENYFLDDGAYLATKIVIKLAKLKKSGVGISVLLDGLKEPKEAIEKRFPIIGEDFAVYAGNVLDDFKSWAAASKDNGISIVEPNYEGVRLSFNLIDTKGWCLLRKSLHDPILPLNIEVTEGSCDAILQKIKDFLSKFDRIKID